MSALRLAKTRASEPMLPGPDVSELKQGIRGQLVLPGDPTYDQARRVWNGMVDKRPAAVIYCAGADDVVASVTFARSHNLLVAVRAGGHNIAGSSACDAGLVIDLSHMKQIAIDPVRRLARAEAGLIWASSTRPLRRMVWQRRSASTPTPAYPD